MQQVENGKQILQKKRKWITVGTWVKERDRHWGQAGYRAFGCTLESEGSGKNAFNL